jgi:hypothetical protein
VANDSWNGWDESDFWWTDFCWDFGYSCSCWRLKVQVVCRFENEAEMAEVASSETGRDGTSIGVDLTLESADHHCGWLDVRFELRELFVGENLNEVRVGDRHDRGRKVDEFLIALMMMTN